MSFFDLPPSAPPDLPDTAHERALLLRNQLMSEATGGSAHPITFATLRKEFNDDPRTAKLLPSFLRSCQDPGDFWQFIKHEFSTYKERRDYLRAQFSALLDFLQKSVPLPVGQITEALEAFDVEGVSGAWQKALTRAEDDPEGALTAARTLLESVCLHIIGEDESTVESSKRDDLPKLYRRTSAILNLAPSQHTEQVFKQILGGCTQVVEGLGALRNRLGDAHGKGRRPVRVSPRHAHFAVNLAGAVALFLIETRGAQTKSPEST